MPKSVLIDSGPIVAFLHEEEIHHAWAVDQFRRFGRFTTCEPVLGEACARLAYYGKDPARVIELARDGGWDTGFSVKPNADRIIRLIRKYADQPMEFADACLVAMTEQITDCLVLTLDRLDFSVYRRHERAIVPFIAGTLTFHDFGAAAVYNQPALWFLPTNSLHVTFMTERPESRWE